MYNALMINNMYAAYSANSSSIDEKRIIEMSNIIKNGSSISDLDSYDQSNYMDKLIISKDALLLLKGQLV